MKSMRIAWADALQRQGLAWLLVGLAGWGAVVWLWGPEAAVLDRVHAEVLQFQSRLSAAAMQRTAAVPASLAQAALPVWPAQGHAASLWPWMQQRMQAQGLQVLALRPQRAGTQDLPDYTVSLQLQGRWHDWLALVQDLANHAPWWVVEQWQVVRAGQGMVRLDVQSRVGLLPSALQNPGQATWSGPQWPAANPAPAAGSALFESPVAADGPPSPEATPQGDAAATSPFSSPDPRQWPVHALRLQGVWQQAGRWHAVLGEGGVQTTVREGQQVGAEGFRVHRVDAAGVMLVAGTEALVLRLNGQGDKP